MGDGEQVRVSIPATADFVPILRVVARATAARSGHGDDARSRFQARAGAAFFALCEHAAPEAIVTAVVETRAQRLEMTLTLEPPGAPLPAPDFGEGVEPTADGRSLRVCVEPDPRQ